MFEPRDTYLDKALTNVVVAYSPTGFIADRIFPIVPVGQQSGGFFVWEKADFYAKPGVTTRAPGTKPGKVQFRQSTATFFCTNYALGSQWTAEELANADLREGHRRGKSKLVKTALSLDYETRVSAQVLSTANVGTYSTPASAWSDRTNSNPLDEITNAIEAVRLSTGGYKPNRIVMGQPVMTALAKHDTLRGLLYPHGGGLVTAQQLANLFEVDEVLVGGAMYNNVADGVLSSTSWAPTEFWGPHMLIYYAAPNPSEYEPTYGYAFRWNGPAGHVPFGVNVHPWDTEARAQNFDEMYYQDEKLVDTRMAYLVQSCVGW